MTAQYCRQFSFKSCALLLAVDFLCHCPSSFQLPYFATYCPYVKPCCLANTHTSAMLTLGFSAFLSFGFGLAHLPFAINRHSLLQYDFRRLLVKGLPQKLHFIVCMTSVVDKFAFNSAKAWLLQLLQQ
jgi:hypothetical protein